MWAFSEPDSLNAFWHTQHMYGLSPVCTLMCRVRCSAWQNAFWHTLHLYGFSPLWILLCILRFPACVNRFPQTEHSNGFSPEWVRLCLVKSTLHWKHFPHSLHLNLQLWIFMCALKFFWLVKLFSHWAQENDFGLLHTRIGSTRDFIIANRSSLSRQASGCDLASCGLSATSLLSSSVLISNQLSPESQ